MEGKSGALWEGGDDFASLSVPERGNARARSAGSTLAPLRILASLRLGLASPALVPGFEPVTWSGAC